MPIHFDENGKKRAFTNSKTKPTDWVCRDYLQAKYNDDIRLYSDHEPTERGEQ